MLKSIFKHIGPGTLIAAAFIGPGTITICTIAGVNFGFGLLWAMVLSIVITIILQEMAARLGLVSQKGLSQVVREQIKNPFLKRIVVLIILAAIVIGNAAYEAGNISGGRLGLEAVMGDFVLLLGDFYLNIWSVLIGIIAFSLLYIGKYKVIERVLVTLVILMSISFLFTAIITKPNFLEILKGFFVPNINETNFLTILALIGTTVVPYNLFLHASLVQEKWKKKEDLNFVKKDIIISIVLGGVVSIAIIISAASVSSDEIESAVDLAEALVPLYGKFSKYFLAIGLFAAGITSAITAPLAAAYVAKGCLNFKGSLQSWNFRLVWITVLLTGVVFSSIGLKPIEIIKFAQIANGILLPVIGMVLFWIMNKKEVLGEFVNTKRQNIIGFVIVGFTIFLGIKGILSVFNLI